VPTDDHRLERIETKLDGLAQAMSKLVAVETHLQHYLDRMHRMESRQDAFDERLRSQGNIEASSSTSTSLMERFVLVTVSVVGTALMAWAVAGASGG